ncbi:MAG: glycoside hydrolase family 32 protein [Bacteroidia bacterium]|nr:glycoside hydrolase family 32 protein [Bacteroidia bacterium]
MCLALPEDESLLTWKKYEKNPVVNGTPKQYSRFDFRDPYLWKEGDMYYMAVGFGIDENNTRRGALLLYKSPDLKQWEFLHTLFEGNPAEDDSGVFWEMPVFGRKMGNIFYW